MSGFQNIIYKCQNFEKLLKTTKNTKRLKNGKHRHSLFCIIKTKSAYLYLFSITCSLEQTCLKQVRNTIFYYNRNIFVIYKYKL